MNVLLRSSLAYSPRAKAQSRFASSSAPRLKNPSEDEMALHDANNMLFLGQLGKIIQAPCQGNITFFHSDRSLHYDYNPQRQQVPLTLQILNDKKQILATVGCEVQSLQPKAEVDAVLRQKNLSPDNRNIAQLYRILTAPRLTRCVVDRKDLNVVQEFFRDYGGEILVSHLQFQVLDDQLKAPMEKVS